MAFVGAAATRWRGGKRQAACARPRLAAVGIRRGVATMVASTEGAADIELSPEALRCLSFLRGQRSIFDARDGFSAVDAALMRKNDTARSYINDTQLDFATGAPGRELHKKVRDKADAISKRALDKVVAKYGLASKPTAVKTVDVDAQWILRVVSYGVAGKSTSFLNRESVKLYKDVYACIGGGKGMALLFDLLVELKNACATEIGSHETDRFFDSAVSVFRNVV